MKHALLTLTVALTVGAATAGPIYRCGPDGKTYSQVPCAEGTVVESSDPRTAAQRAEARRVAAAERKAAADLERARKAQEKAAPALAPAATLSPPPAASAAASASRGSKQAGTAKTAAAQGFVATVPRDKAARK
jgi:hypothetical protein